MTSTAIGTKSRAHDGIGPLFRETRGWNMATARVQRGRTRWAVRPRAPRVPPTPSELTKRRTVSSIVLALVALLVSVFSGTEPKHDRGVFYDAPSWAPRPIIAPTVAGGVTAEPALPAPPSTSNRGEAHLLSGDGLSYAASNDGPSWSPSPNPLPPVGVLRSYGERRRQVRGKVAK